MGLWTPICHHVQEAGKWVLKPLQVCQVLMEQSCKATKQAMSAQGSGSLHNGAPTLVKAAGLGPQLPLTLSAVPAALLDPTSLDLAQDASRVYLGSRMLHM